MSLTVPQRIIVGSTVYIHRPQGSRDLYVPEAFAGQPRPPAEHTWRYSLSAEYQNTVFFHNEANGRSVWVLPQLAPDGTALPADPEVGMQPVGAEPSAAAALSSEREALAGDLQQRIQEAISRAQQSSAGVEGNGGGGGGGGRTSTVQERLAAWRARRRMEGRTEDASTAPLHEQQPQKQQQHDGQQQQQQQVAEQSKEKEKKEEEEKLKGGDSAAAQLESPQMRAPATATPPTTIATAAAEAAVAPRPAGDEHDDDEVAMAEQAIRAARAAEAHKEAVEAERRERVREAARVEERDRLRLVRQRKEMEARRLALEQEALERRERLAAAQKEEDERRERRRRELSFRSREAALLETARAQQTRSLAAGIAAAIEERLAKEMRAAEAAAAALQQQQRGTSFVDAAAGPPAQAPVRVRLDARGRRIGLGERESSGRAMRSFFDGTLVGDLREGAGVLSLPHVAASGFWVRDCLDGPCTLQTPDMKATVRLTRGGLEHAETTAQLRDPRTSFSGYVTHSGQQAGEEEGEGEGGDRVLCPVGCMQLATGDEIEWVMESERPAAANAAGRRRATGAVVARDSDRGTGLARVTLKNGDTYEGPITDMRLEGPNAAFRSPSRRVEYYGGFRNGAPHGEGVLFFGSGNVYAGGFKDGCFDGRGTYLERHKYLFEGEWEMGSPCGRGRLYMKGANGDESRVWEGKVHGDKRTTGSYVKAA